MTDKGDYFKTFCKVTQAFATTQSREELLELIVQSAIDTMNGKAACLYLTYEEDDVFEPVARKGLSQSYLHASPLKARKIVDEIMKGGYLAFKDATSDPRLEHHAAKKAEGIASILTVPVIVKNMTIGVLSLYTDTPRDFQKDEIDFLNALADQGGIAIEQARLVRRIRANTQLFHKLAININSTLDIKAIFHSLSAEIAEAFEVKAVSIRLLDENRDTLKYVAGFGLSEQYLKKGPISAEKSIAGALEDKVMVVQNAATDPGVQYREEKKDEGIVSILCVPIKNKEDVIGVMRLYSSTSRDFTKDEIMLAGALAQQGGLAIQNASLYMILKEDKKALEEDIWSHRMWF